MKMLYVVLAGCCLAGPAVAQDQNPLSASAMVSQMQARLHLTEDQVAAVTPIIEKYTSKLEDLRQGLGEGLQDQGGRRIEMKKLRANETEELSQVLSNLQLSQWKQMQAARPKSKGDEQVSSPTASGESRDL